MTPPEQLQPTSQLELWIMMTQAEQGFEIRLEEWLSKCGPRWAASAIHRNLLERHILGPTADLLNQKLWGWGQATWVLMSFPSDCGTQYSLKTTALGQRERYSKIYWGFPGGAVVENLPANAGDTGSSPGLGRSHMPRSNWAREPQLLSLRVWSLCSVTREAAIVRGPRTAMKSGPRWPQLEKALAQKRRPNTAENI